MRDLALINCKKRLIFIVFFWNSPRIGQNLKNSRKIEFFWKTNLENGRNNWKLTQIKHLHPKWAYLVKKPFCGISTHNLIWLILSLSASLSVANANGSVCFSALSSYSQLFRWFTTLQATVHWRKPAWGQDGERKRTPAGFTSRRYNCHLIEWLERLANIDSYEKRRREAECFCQKSMESREFRSPSSSWNCH